MWKTAVLFFVTPLFGLTWATSATGKYWKQEYLL